MAIAAIFLIEAQAAWPLRVAFVAGTLTNLEALLITCVLPTWQANVPSLYHALQRRWPGRRGLE